MTEGAVTVSCVHAIGPIGSASEQHPPHHCWSAHTLHCAVALFPFLFCPTRSARTRSTGPPRVFTAMSSTRPAPLSGRTARWLRRTRSNRRSVGVDVSSYLYLSIAMLYRDSVPAAVQPPEGYLFICLFVYLFIFHGVQSRLSC